jgi:hypothetical protein
VFFVFFNQEEEVKKKNLLFDPEPASNPELESNPEQKKNTVHPELLFIRNRT